MIVVEELNQIEGVKTLRNGNRTICVWFQSLILPSNFLGQTKQKIEMQVSDVKDLKVETQRDVQHKHSSHHPNSFSLVSFV